MALNVNPVNWFEIPAEDLNRAKTFYENIFGIEMEINNMGNLKMAWFPFKQDGTGATGTLMEAESYVPSYSGPLVYFSVTDIPEILDNVRKNGGKVLTEKMSIGEFGFVGHFEDCEGNRIGLHSNT